MAKISGLELQILARTSGSRHQESATRVRWRKSPSQVLVCALETANLLPGRASVQGGVTRSFPRVRGGVAGISSRTVTPRHRATPGSTNTHTTQLEKLLLIHKRQPERECACTATRVGFTHERSRVVGVTRARAGADRCPRRGRGRVEWEVAKSCAQTRLLKSRLRGSERGCIWGDRL